MKKITWYKDVNFKAYYNGVEFDLFGELNQDIKQAMLYYLNSLGDPVFHIKDNWRFLPNDISNFIDSIFPYIFSDSNIKKNKMKMR